MKYKRIIFDDFDAILSLEKFSKMTDEEYDAFIKNPENINNIYDEEIQHLKDKGINIIGVDKDIEDRTLTCIIEDNGVYIDYLYIQPQIRCNNCKYQSCDLECYIEYDGSPIEYYDSETLRGIIVDYRTVRLYKIECHFWEELNFIKDFIYYDKVKKCYMVDSDHIIDYIGTDIGYWAEGEFYYYPTDDDTEEYQKDYSEYGEEYETNSSEDEEEDETYF